MKNFNFTIKEEAKNEIFDAYLFYEEKKINLGKRFLESLENYLSSIQLNPKIFAEKYKEFRQAIVNKFPFVVIYKITNKDIIVYAVFHTSRKPNYSNF